MVHVSALFAVLGGLLPFSGLQLVSGSPVNDLKPAALSKRFGGVPDDVTVVPIQWRGSLEEGGPLINLQGDSFEDIEKQAKALNPKCTIFTEPANNTDLVTRQTEDKDIHCDWPPGWGNAQYNHIMDGIAYLRGISGDCRAPPGPGNCGRVSCSWGAAIYYCNDNPHEHWVRCAKIGDVARAIATKCYGWAYFRGQGFDKGNWNTIIAAGDC
ncbi:hypothetical protein B0T14DRAFT_494110 [Immersiella caudata]|uniref:Uncharacterized protein n=1 Tax=Immersiella caudata TaxID=314043 RepID=A0AA39WVQ6_9PEZI|nr:hypothetical protein B0T14DRAFT_494110 [Immersiella caudata]